MFPFAMQAKLAEAWLDAAAAGFAMAGSMGAAASRGFDPLLPSARPSYAFSFWTPVMTPASAWPWSWFTGFGSPAPTNWWRSLVVLWRLDAHLHLRGHRKWLAHVSAGMDGGIPSGAVLLRVSHSVRADLTAVLSVARRHCIDDRGQLSDRQRTRNRNHLRCTDAATNKLGIGLLEHSPAWMFAR